MKGSSAIMEFSFLTDTLKIMESKKTVDLSEDLITLKKQFYDATNENLELEVLKLDLQLKEYELTLLKKEIQELRKYSNLF